MPILPYLSNLNMGAGAGFVPIPDAIVPPRDPLALVEDYRRPMLKKSKSLDRLYARQVRERKKIKIGEGKGKWFDRLIESNNMRAQLLASL